MIFLNRLAGPCVLYFLNIFSFISIYFLAARHFRERPRLFLAAPPTSTMVIGFDASTTGGGALISVDSGTFNPPVLRTGVGLGPRVPRDGLNW